MSRRQLVGHPLVGRTAVSLRHPVADLRSASPCLRCPSLGLVLAPSGLRGTVSPRPGSGCHTAIMRLRPVGAAVESRCGSADATPNVGTESATQAVGSGG